ncbi:MAG: hypothetical protein RR790_01910, partial [Eubacterium sp.]
MALSESSIQAVATGDVITDANFACNKYERFYYVADRTYTYNGESVTFKDENTITVNGQEKALKNCATVPTITVKDGTATIKLSGIKNPIGGIPGEWNINFGGGAQIVYDTDITGKETVSSTLNDDEDFTLTISALTPGTYHLTNGRIFEKANDYSPGTDLGNGVVTQGYFRALPELTVVVEGSVGAEQAVIDMISALPKTDALTLENADAVYSARTAYTALTPEEQALVTNIEILKAAEAKIESLEKPVDQYLGDKTEAKVYDDFENDIWLQFQQKDLKIGETAKIRPWRLEQAVTDSINNDVARPNFNFEIISGDSITLDQTKTDDKAIATAVKPGTSVVKVTYDALTHGKTFFPAISVVNTAYAVITVGEEGTANVNVSEGLKNWRHYDTVYYKEGTTTPYAFTVDAQNATRVKVTCNGLELKGDGNQYTAPLENRSNIIGVVTTDAAGKTKSLYRVIDARFIEVNVKNKTAEGQPLKNGHTANISFRGITMPVYKLATIYNPCMNGLGQEATHVLYNNPSLGDFKGKCNQWDLSKKNHFDVTFTDAGTFEFTSAGIYSEWWGSELGADLTANGSGEPNLGAPVLKDIFSTMPNFSVQVEADVFVDTLTLDKETLNLGIDETASLTATVTPENASGVIKAWSSSDE